MAPRPDASVQAVVVAAGRSRRMGALGQRKPWLPLAGRTVLEWSCGALAASPDVRRTVVVVHPDDLDRTRALAAAGRLGRVAAVVPGGEERLDSVRAGAAVDLDGATLLAVHDAARPCVDAGSLERLFAAAEATGAALLAVPVGDTLKRGGDDERARETVDRTHLWAAQTPQVFRAGRFRELLARAVDEGFRPTDDAALWERWEGPVRLVRGSPSNLKITYPTDLPVAASLLALRGEAEVLEGARSVQNLRIGTGFDVHRLVEGRPCVLGGVELPHPRGPEGHSDGDAVLHAITDAVLGAAGLDDLGTLFPDTDEAYRGAASGKLLRRALDEIVQRGFSVVNVDVVIATEGPRIAPHRAEMRRSIAALLDVAPERVNLKGKSLEGLGALAGGAGVAVQAVCLLAVDPAA